MRKLLFCVPMMILLLSACTGGAEGNEAEEQMCIRDRYILPCKEGADPLRARIIKHKI